MSSRTATESKLEVWLSISSSSLEIKLQSPIYLSIYLDTVLRIRLKVVLNNGHAKKE